MDERKKPRSALGVGITTLVTIVVAVLLTTFSVLALVTARADLRLSNRAIESSQSYYAADGQAEQWMATLDSFTNQNKANLLNSLTAGGYAATPKDGNWIVIDKRFSIDTTRDLLVEVAVNSNGELDVLKWQTTSKL